jgi:DNA-binding Xre family transcriptional regulator
VSAYDADILQAHKQIKTDIAKYMFAKDYAIHCIKQAVTRLKNDNSIHIHTLDAYCNNLQFEVNSVYQYIEQLGIDVMLEIQNKYIDYKQTTTGMSIDDRHE